MGNVSGAFNSLRLTTFCITSQCSSSHSIGHTVLIYWIVRIIIWNYSVSPRVVEVRFSPKSQSNKYDFVADPPALFHTSQESRQQGLEVSELIGF